ncbi:MAG: ribosome silencing factor [Eubacterium sp.]|nr:ribosome silencing factor [Eubacterium sp.]
MTDYEILTEGVKALDSKKAFDIKVLKVRDLTILSNYFVIAGASSTTQAKALADEVEFKLGEKGVNPRHYEGRQSANWIVLDYVDVIFHIFHSESREFYDLERLWQDGEEIDVEELLK